MKLVFNRGEDNTLVNYTYTYTYTNTSYHLAYEGNKWHRENGNRRKERKEFGFSYPFLSTLLFTLF